MLYQIVASFDKIHFSVYSLLIKSIGYSQEQEITDIYLLTTVQFISCMLMSALIVTPFFVVIVSGYLVYNKIGRKRENDSEISNEEKKGEEIKNENKEKTVHVTNETIKNRFEPEKKVDTNNKEKQEKEEREETEGKNKKKKKL